MSNMYTKWKLEVSSIPDIMHQRQIHIHIRQGYAIIEVIHHKANFIYRKLKYIAATNPWQYNCVFFTFYYTSG